ncbi:MAG: CapA family protein [Chloroflexia bacterium]|nr:CapA family protein [Chloroflexia bacterium]
MVIEEKGWRVAVFNYTYGINGDTYSPKMIINEIDTLVIKKRLSRSKGTKL